VSHLESDGLQREVAQQHIEQCPQTFGVAFRSLLKRDSEHQRVSHEMSEIPTYSRAFTMKGAGDPSICLSLKVCLDVGIVLSSLVVVVVHVGRRYRTLRNNVCKVVLRAQPLAICATPLSPRPASFCLNHIRFDTNQSTETPIGLNPIESKGA